MMTEYGLDDQDMVPDEDTTVSRQTLGPVPMKLKTPPASVKVMNAWGCASTPSCSIKILLILLLVCVKSLIDVHYVLMTSVLD